MYSENGLKYQELFPLDSADFPLRCRYEIKARIAPRAFLGNLIPNFNAPLKDVTLKSYIKKII
jgi:hypothetical protein